MNSGSNRRRSGKQGDMAKKTQTKPRSRPAAGPSAQAEAASETAAPASERLSFPVVGVGASAGGLEAFTRLLRALPIDSGMAFVLVQHLAPAHDSALAGILSRATTMPVTEVMEERRVEPNHVYVIPPDRNMVLVHGHLQLQSRARQGMQHPIDLFFRSLAHEQRELAIGVVLSGTATDGTIGLEEIKSEGGITFAQDDSAQYDGMPKSATASGCVDFTLTPEGIAQEIVRIVAHPYVTRAAARPDTAEGAVASASDKAALTPILHLLHDSTGVDFSSYKTNTLARRITRRMVLHKLDSHKAYARMLREDPAELEALYRDILINVTSFFRDPEMFEVLKERVIPALLHERSRHDPLRVWVLGCSTGEEAYSLAMVLSEVMDSHGGQAPAQIFATDLNAADVDFARVGMYPRQRIQDLSRGRLRRFFVESSGGFRVSKPLRDMCVFARQNVLADPPFSRMDLITCRNLLIYMEPTLQQKIIPLLHYALKPEGHLVLGASESVGPFRGLFQTEDSKHKIFARRSGPVRLPVGLPVPRSRAVAAPAAASAGPDGHNGDVAPLRSGYAGSELHREADRLLLSRFAPPSVLVNTELEILQFRGNTEPYLAPAQGKASLNLLKMAREGLLVPLQALMQTAKRGLVPVRDEGLKFKSNDALKRLNLEVVPLRGSAPSEMAFMVIFEDVSMPEASPVAARPRGGARPGPKSGPRATSETSEASVTRLEHELASTREYLQSLIEQQDAANEELQSANEEVQSANEELQSINEELETSKEEIQSSNEELSTVNDELGNRIFETGQLNSDLTNLISSIQTAIVIVGRDLRIRRYSPMAEQLLNVIPTDIGRPLTDIRMNLEVPELDVLLTQAIDTVSIREREIQDKQARWYSLRIRPYMTLDNKIDGAVLMLMDIDQLKQAEQAIVTARDYAESIVGSVRDPLLILNADLSVRTANEAFYTTFKVSRTDTEGRSLFELGNGQWKIPELRQRLETVLPMRSSFYSFEVTQEFETIGRRTLLLSAHPLGDAAGLPPGILVGLQDITELLHFQIALRRSELRYRRLFEAAKDGVLIMDPATRRIIDANPFMTELLGYTHEELLGRELFEIGLLKDEASSQAAFRALQDDGFLRYDDLPLETKTGLRREVELVSNLYREAEDTIIQCNVRDITARKHSEALARQLELDLAKRAEELAAIDIEKGQFLAVLAHELRSPLNAIRGWLQILQRPGRSEADLERGLDVIDRNSKVQIDLISDLLDAHRIGAGKASLELQDIDLCDSVEAALATAEPALAEKNIRLEREFTPGSSPVSADPGRMQQVLGNLLTNALKFTPAGGTIRITLRHTPSRVELLVADSGEGISAEALPHIFEPFRQAESEISRGHGGLGLGLTIAWQIMQMHAGSIEARSPGRGQGATFTLTLPLRSVVSPNHHSVSPASAIAAPPGSLRGVMVLVVDDEPDAREPVRRVLEEAGAEVVAVASAAEALEAVRQQRPDVLVSDVAMPGGDGYQLMRSIRELPPGRGGRVPAIALTAYTTAADRERALSAGFNLHVGKPVEPAALIAAVAALAAPAGADIAGS